MNEKTLQLPQEGDKIGSGIILCLISMGGSARVYKTWVETLEIHRAVKVMNPDADQDIRARFATEARISSKLTHPNIVQVYNFGETPTGLPYIEMELISGQTLEALLRQREELPLPVALAVVMGVLEAVNYAHNVNYTLYDQSQRGLMHRDIKPANVIFSGGVPKLMDFGIARPVAVSMHTTAGAMPGTMAYMAPESCSGGNSDFRSDIYQIGLLLYECISGRMAYPQRDLMPLMEAISTGNRKPLENAGKAAAIVKKCLEIDPNKRYQTAQDCLDDIRGLYRSLSPNITPEAQILSFFQGGSLVATPFKRKRPGGNRKALTIAAIASAAVAVTFSAGLIILNRVMPDPPADEVEASSDAAPIPTDEVEASDDAAPVFALAEVAVDDEEETPPPPPPPPPTKTAASARPTSAPSPPPTVSKQASAPAEEPSTDDARFFIEGGRNLLSQGRPQEALASFQRAMRMSSSSMPRQEIVRQSLYGAAKSNTLLYKQGSVPRESYDSSWQSVAETFPAGTAEHNEAVNNLKNN